MKKIITLLVVVLLIGLQNTKAQNFDWAKQFVGTNVNFSTGITTDDLGNVYNVGVFYGTIDCDPNSGTYELVSGGDSDIYISKMDASGNFIWAKQFAGMGASGASSIAIDAFGDIYIGGSFLGEIEFDMDGDNVTLFSNGAEDPFLAKLNTSGDVIWFKQFEGTSNSYGRCISIDTDQAGNVYAVGDFAGAIDFNPGSETYELSVATEDNNAVFISKLSASGDFEWAKKFAPAYLFNDLVYATSLAIDNNGNVYTSGYFYGTIDFNPGLASHHLVSGPFNSFMSKLDTDGNFVWAKRLYGLEQNFVSSISADASGNIYAVGTFKNQIFLNDEPNVFSLTSVGSQPDGFMAKFSSSGDFIWAHQIETSDSYINIASNTIDLSGNNYIIGNFTGTIDFPDPSTGGVGFGLSAVQGQGVDKFIAKVDAHGDYLWVKKIDLMYDQPTDYIAPSSIVIDNTGNIYTAGSFRGVVNFDSYPEEYLLFSPDHHNTYVHKLEQSILSLSSDSWNENVSVYPNPSTGKFYLSLDGEYGDISITIQNAIGQKIMKETYTGSNLVEFNIVGSPGVYFAHIEKSSQQKTVKIVVE